MKVSTQQYAKTLLELTDGKSEQEVLDIVKKFAEVLKKDGQLKNAKNIIEKFSDLYNKEHGIVYTLIVGRQKVSQDVLEKVNEFVKRKYSAKEVEIENVVDEKIKGGIVIKVGDEVIDASVDAQLKRLKNILSK